ncbi:hypothetical protein TNCV_56431 [Trichonephila clavipes]|nr:hypothetical protein TNCV_56431 [Trichonephila clavipes]
MSKVSVWTDLPRAVIEQLMDGDRRWALLDLERASDIEKRTVLGILRIELQLRKIAARWVPYVLTEVQRCFSHRWQRVVTVAGDYIEGF